MYYRTKKHFAFVIYSFASSHQRQTILNNVLMLVWNCVFGSGSNIRLLLFTTDLKILVLFMLFVVNKLRAYQQSKNAKEPFIYSLAKSYEEGASRASSLHNGQLDCEACVRHNNNNNQTRRSKFLLWSTLVNPYTMFVVFNLCAAMMWRSRH